MLAAGSHPSTPPPVPSKNDNRFVRHEDTPTVNYYAYVSTIFILHYCFSPYISQIFFYRLSHYVRLCKRYLSNSMKPLKEVHVIFFWYQGWCKKLHVAGTVQHSWRNPEKWLLYFSATLFWSLQFEMQPLMHPRKERFFHSEQKQKMHITSLLWPCFLQKLLMKSVSKRCLSFYFLYKTKIFYSPVRGIKERNMLGSSAYGQYKEYTCTDTYRHFWVVPVFWTLWRRRVYGVLLHTYRSKSVETAE